MPVYLSWLDVCFHNLRWGRITLHVANDTVNIYWSMTHDGSHKVSV
jgi:hypothetical protein